MAHDCERGAEKAGNNGDSNKGNTNVPDDAPAASRQYGRNAGSESDMATARHFFLRDDFRATLRFRVGFLAAPRADAALRVVRRFLTFGPSPTKIPSRPNFRVESGPLQKPPVKQEGRK